ncbi:MAG: hypothetical protein LC733_04885 [Actinobacteria bacterium]|nr:hypothetical protein [Actinomycetota bacterium]
MALVAAWSSSCSSPENEPATPVPATTVVAGTPSSPPSSSTTTVGSTIPTTSPPTTASPASSPEGYAQALYEAWTKGDLAAAEKVAEPQAVADLFARPWQATDGWSFAECSGAAGSIICTWQRPSGQKLLLRVQNLTGGLPVIVSDVRFQP